MSEILTGNTEEIRRELDTLQMHALSSLVYCTRSVLFHEEICQHIRSVFYITQDINATVDALQFSTLRTYCRGPAMSHDRCVEIEYCSLIREADVVWALVCAEADTHNLIAATAHALCDSKYSLETLPYDRGIIQITPDMLQRRRCFIDKRDLQFCNLEDVP